MVKILLFFILGALPVIQGSITHYGTYGKFSMINVKECSNFNYLILIDLPGYPTKVYYYDKDNQVSYWNSMEIILILFI